MIPLFQATGLGFIKCALLQGTVILTPVAMAVEGRVLATFTGTYSHPGSLALSFNYTSQHRLYGKHGCGRFDLRDSACAGEMQAHMVVVVVVVEVVVVVVVAVVWC